MFASVDKAFINHCFGHGKDLALLMDMYCFGRFQASDRRALQRLAEALCHLTVQRATSAAALHKCQTWEKEFLTALEGDVTAWQRILKKSVKRCEAERVTSYQLGDALWKIDNELRELSEIIAIAASDERLLHQWSATLFIAAKIFCASAKRLAAAASHQHDREAIVDVLQYFERVPKEHATHFRPKECHFLKQILLYTRMLRQFDEQKDFGVQERALYRSLNYCVSIDKWEPPAPLSLPPCVLDSNDAKDFIASKLPMSQRAVGSRDRAEQTHVAESMFSRNCSVFTGEMSSCKDDCSSVSSPQKRKQFPWWRRRRSGGRKSPETHDGCCAATAGEQSSTVKKLRKKPQYNVVFV